MVVCYSAKIKLFQISVKNKLCQNKQNQRLDLYEFAFFTVLFLQKKVQWYEYIVFLPFFGCNERSQYEEILFWFTLKKL